MPQLTVHVQNLQKDLPLHRFYRKHIHNIVEQVLLLEQKQYHEVSIYLVDIPKICQIHSDFFADPSPTDCISFPMDEEQDDGMIYHVLGDVFVCPSVAIDYANENEGDPYEETTLYIVHGLLHLLGYDDLSTKEEKKMRAAETKVMQKLRSGSFYLKPPKNHSTDQS